MRLVSVTLALAAGLAVSACATDSAYAPGGYYASTGRYYSDYCRDRERQGTAAGAVIGGVAGAAIGAGVAGSGDRTEGAIVGGVLGAAAGAAVGNRAAQCDETGIYWDEASTYPYTYRSGYRGRFADDWYVSRRCRWAQNWRGDWVRVCPDTMGRFRVYD